MIDVPTVLVLGAGASKPYYFPTGEGLRELVLGSLTTKTAAFDTLQSICSVAPPALQDQFFEHSIKDFVAAFLHSGQRSIDAFLEHRPEWKVLGKAIIAQALIPIEMENSLFPGRDWYQQLGEALAGPFAQLHTNRLSIITFNYDRSLEHYLFTSWLYSYGKPAHEVAGQLGQIPIVHVHGALGDLPWTGSANVRPYENTATAETIFKASQGIRIIHEDTDFKLQLAHDLLGNAGRVVFLGFGFAETNMRRLAVDKLCGTKVPIFGTCMGLSAKQGTALNQKYFGGRATLLPRECSVLIAEEALF